MAWEWSHSPEAYGNAREQLDTQDREWLRECFSEWFAEADPTEYAGGFNEARYRIAMIQAVDLPNDILADSIWGKMEARATCDNGGHNAWACPTGCHTVPFDPVDSAGK